MFDLPKCPACGGEGWTYCRICDGSGKVECPATHSPDSTCTTCNGDGEVFCKNCNGMSKVRCPRCGGNGYVND